MSHYQGSAPDTEPGRQWLENAACAGYGDRMFPDSNETGIAYAKTICARCTARTACLTDALSSGDNQWGIRGELEPKERRALVKHLTPAQLDNPAAVEAAATQFTHTITAEQGFRHVWEDRTHELPGGHLGWRGSTSALTFRGRSYTPKQISFLLHRGHAPVGIVRRTCEVVECVHPLHLSDNEERYLQRAAAAAKAVGEQVAV